MIAPANRRTAAHRLLPAACRGRGGLTLLEIVVAAALMGGVTASLHMVLRGTVDATDQLRGENDALRHADAGIRFLTRRCREAEGVAQIGGTTNESFHVDVGNGETVRYFREAGSNTLQMTDSRITDGISQTIADGVTGFTPTFYMADGVTATTVPAEARLIDITLTVDLPRDAAAGRTVRGRVWVRRW
ncbi:PulJ/GspJ family protein [Alienimonas chondri]|uniref:Prepilin-type N-terminal cleavage/methylation domain-containing protein n=1 Tax=Alienimonas chondri TaxID=2681879 RepID=A0ABX1VER2_9PLAN|nr:hypothetical protein [Alienimonas chondri]NNJ26268.1 hypothetical protein [Alienimonas chondri]